MTIDNEHDKPYEHHLGVENIPEEEPYREVPQQDPTPGEQTPRPQEDRPDPSETQPEPSEKPIPPNPDKASSVIYL